MPVLVPRDPVVIEAAVRDLPVAVLASGSVPARAYVRVARAVLDQWHQGMPSASTPMQRSGGPAKRPDPGWTRDARVAAVEAEAIIAPPLPGRRVVLAMLWITVGAILGAALTVAVLKEAELPFPV